MLCHVAGSSSSSTLTNYVKMAKGLVSGAADSSGICTSAWFELQSHLSLGTCLGFDIAQWGSHRRLHSNIITLSVTGESHEPMGGKLCPWDWCSATQFPIAQHGHFLTCCLRPASASAFPLSWNSRSASPVPTLFCPEGKNPGLIHPAVNKQVSRIVTKEPASIMERGERDGGAMKWREGSQST